MSARMDTYSRHEDDQTSFTMSITKQYLEIQEVGACYASHFDVCYQISALLLKGKRT